LICSVIILVVILLRQTDKPIDSDVTDDVAILLNNEASVSSNEYHFKKYV